jgi:acyl-CoA thioester hydrolase
MTVGFVHAMQVRFADTDAQGHMYFANYLTFCDEALAATMRHYGCPWQDLVGDHVDMFYRAASCEYEGSATFEMILDIETRFRRIGNTSVECEFELRNPDGDRIAVANVTFVCIDPRTRSPVRVPARLREAAARASSDP